MGESLNNPGIVLVGDPFLAYQSQGTPWGAGAGENEHGDWSVGRHPLIYTRAEWHGVVSASNCAWSLAVLVGHSASGLNLTGSYDGTCPTALTGNNDAQTQGSPYLGGYRYRYSTALPGISSTHSWSWEIPTITIGQPTQPFDFGDIPQPECGYTDLDFHDGDAVPTHLTITVEGRTDITPIPTQPFDLYLYPPEGTTASWLADDGTFGALPSSYEGQHVGVMPAGGGTVVIELDEAALAPYITIDGAGIVTVAEVRIHAIVAQILSTTGPGTVAMAEANESVDFVGPALQATAQWTFITPEYDGWFVENDATESGGIAALLTADAPGSDPVPYFPKYEIITVSATEVIERIIIDEAVMGTTEDADNFGPLKGAALHLYNTAGDAMLVMWRQQFNPPYQFETYLAHCRLSPTGTTILSVTPGLTTGSAVWDDYQITHVKQWGEGIYACNRFGQIATLNPGTLVAENFSSNEPDAVQTTWHGYRSDIILVNHTYDLIIRTYQPDLSFTSVGTIPLAYGGLDPAYVNTIEPFSFDLLGLTYVVTTYFDASFTTVTARIDVYDSTYEQVPGASLEFALDDTNASYYTQWSAHIILGSDNLPMVVAAFSPEADVEGTHYIQESRVRGLSITEPAFTSGWRKISQTEWNSQVTPIGWVANEVTSYSGFGGAYPHVRGSNNNWAVGSFRYCYELCTAGFASTEGEGALVLESLHLSDDTDSYIGDAYLMSICSLGLLISNLAGLQLDPRLYFIGPPR